jgi:hypothetical protein
MLLGIGKNNNVSHGSVVSPDAKTYIKIRNVKNFSMDRYSLKSNSLKMKFKTKKLTAFD